MAITTSLPLSTVLTVSVVVSASGSPTIALNQGLIVGPSAVISPTQRMLQFNSLTAVAAAGFPTTSAEYLAAQIYFSQSPAPFFLWIGCQVSTALQVVAVGASGGTGYVVGDTLTVVQSGASAGQVLVSTISAGGVVTGVNLISGSQGYGYSIANNLATTGGNGSGAQITISAIGETPAQAVAACRVYSPQWYSCVVVGKGASTTGTASSSSTALTVASGTGIVVGQLAVGVGIPTNTTVASGSGTSWVLSAATTQALSVTPVYFYNPNTQAEMQDIAAYVQGCTPPTVYFLNTGSATVLSNNSGNLFANLESLTSTRTLGVYSTPQNGQFPSNLFFAAAPMGLAMGLNTGTAGSYFDLMFKVLVGVATEPLSQSQVNTICGSVDRTFRGLCGNVYLNFANGSYAWMQNATMFSAADNVFFDEVLFLDMLASQIQYNGVNLLTSVPSLPITDAGVALMANTVNQACTQSQSFGFIAPSGIWAGPTIGPISAGTALPKGFYVYTPPVSTLTIAQRGARQLPAMNVLLIEAQSGHSLAITVNVQN